MPRFLHYFHHKSVLDRFLTTRTHIHASLASILPTASFPCDCFWCQQLAAIFHSHRERSTGADNRPRPTTTVQTRSTYDRTAWYLRTEPGMRCKFATVLLCKCCHSVVIHFSAFIVYNLRFWRGTLCTLHPPVWSIWNTALISRMRMLFVLIDSKCRADHFAREYVFCQSLPNLSVWPAASTQSKPCSIDLTPQQLSYW